jgi:hypothetical protein
VNQILAELKVEQHPDKTFVGRVSRGFEFLGYSFSSGGLSGAARKTVEKFAVRVNQLYEQGATASRIGNYVRRWQTWLGGGLTGLCEPYAEFTVVIDAGGGDLDDHCRKHSRLRRANPKPAMANNKNPDGSGTPCTEMGSKLVPTVSGIVLPIRSANPALNDAEYCE